MDYKEETLNQLSKRAGGLSGKSTLIGFDGFVDKIVTPIDQRLGSGDQFKAIASISQFGDRIKEAAGKSTNIEIYPKIEKLGGNGPIMANALLATGQKVRYIGALGKPHIHPVFEAFAKKTEAISICEPGITHTIEFDDGKIMLGSMASLDEITYPHLVKKATEGLLRDCFSRADLIAMVNWSMIPHLTSVFNAFLESIFPSIGPRENRTFFFDLADPEKRTSGDIKIGLETIKRFQNHGHVILGLNLKEAQEIYKVLGHKAFEEIADNLKTMAADIRQDLEIATVVIHTTKSAVCATRHDNFYIDSSFTENPYITTDAGGHFNAGFVTGHLLGLNPECALTLAAAFLGFYVRKSLSPSLSDITAFISEWK